jgi:metal-sulfur cluster biosynthetic enzyme
MDDAELLNLLRDCYDPVLRRNIVDAGLIRSATLLRDDDAPGAGIAGVPPRYVAKITLLAPGADEVANAQLTAQIENRLLGLEAISQVTVTLLPALFPIL